MTWSKSAGCLQRWSWARLPCTSLSFSLLLLLSSVPSRADSITLPSSPDPWQQLVQTWNDGKPLMLGMPLSVMQLEQRLAAALTYSRAQEQTISALIDSLSKQASLLSASDKIRDQQSSSISSLDASLASSQASTAQISKDLTSAKLAALVVEAENRLLRYGMIGAVAVTVVAVIIAAFK
mgnify:CR=1 FL=1